MRILLCDDLITIHGNINTNLKKLLEEDGHEVRIFDGRKDGMPLRRVHDCAEELQRVLKYFGPNRIVFDLHWFNDFQFGLNMLRKLKSNGLISYEDKKLIIYSRFTQEVRDDLVKEFGVSDANIYDRSTNHNRIIRDLFAGL